MLFFGMQWDATTINGWLVHHWASQMSWRWSPALVDVIRESLHFIVWHGFKVGHPQFEMDSHPAWRDLRGDFECSFFKGNLRNAGWWWAGYSRSPTRKSNCLIWHQARRKQLKYSNRLSRIKRNVSGLFKNVIKWNAHHMKWFKFPNLKDGSQSI